MSGLDCAPDDPGQTNSAITNPTAVVAAILRMTIFLPFPLIVGRRKGKLICWLNATQANRERCYQSIPHVRWLISNLAFLPCANLLRTSMGLANRARIGFARFCRSAPNKRSLGPRAIANRARTCGFRAILRHVRKSRDWMVEGVEFEPTGYTGSVRAGRQCERDIARRAGRVTSCLCFLRRSREESSELTNVGAL